MRQEYIELSKNRLETEYYILNLKISRAQSPSREVRLRFQGVSVNFLATRDLESESSCFIIIISERHRMAPFLSLSHIFHRILLTIFLHVFPLVFLFRRSWAPNNPEYFRKLVLITILSLSPKFCFPLNFDILWPPRFDFHPLYRQNRRSRRSRNRRRNFSGAISKPKPLTNQSCANSRCLFSATIFAFECPGYRRI